MSGEAGTQEQEWAVTILPAYRAELARRPAECNRGQVWRPLVDGGCGGAIRRPDRYPREAI